jgi:hypothetical protein
MRMTFQMMKIHAVVVGSVAGLSGHYGRSLCLCYGTYVSLS